MGTYHDAAQFPSLLTSASDLYGASSFRMCEANDFALDMDALDREELALEHMVQALVERKAPVPIGVKFHRPTPLHSACAGGPGRKSTDLGGRDDEVDSGAEERYDRDDDDDDDGDDVEEEGDDDMEEDELDDGDHAFPLDDRDSDDVLESDDEEPFVREDYSLDDMEMDVEESEAVVVEESSDQRQRDAW